MDKLENLNGAALITQERARQVSEERWSFQHEDEHLAGELRRAAMCYLSNGYQVSPAPDGWPWERSSWKPTNYKQNLIKAGALIAAEIDRVTRLVEHYPKEPEK